MQQLDLSCGCILPMYAHAGCRGSDRNSRPWRTYSLGRNAHQSVRQSKTVNSKTSKSSKLEYLVLFPKALAQLRTLWGRGYSSVAGLLLSMEISLESRVLLEVIIHLQ